MTNGTEHPIDEPLVGVREVAEYLSVSRATVYRLAGRPGGVPCVKLAGGLRFRPKEVREYIDRKSLRGTGRTRAEKLLAATQATNR